MCSEQRVGLVLGRGAGGVLLDLAVDLLRCRLDGRAVDGDAGLLLFGAFGFGDVLLGFEGGDTAGAY